MNKVVVICVLIAVLVGFAAEQAHGVVWITSDAQGKYTQFELPSDHPALLATGEDAAQWTKTEFLLAHEQKQLGT